MNFLKRAASVVNKYYGTFIGTLLTIIFISILFFALYPFNVADFKKITVTNTVQVGGVLTYTNEYCQNVGKGIDREIERYLIPRDKELVSPVELSGNPTNETINEAGCRTSDPIRLPIDSSIPPGEYKLYVEVKYCIFPGRCIPESGESDYFIIGKPNIENQLVILNTKIDEVNQQLADRGITTVVNTLTVPVPQTVTPPFQEPQPEPQPQTSAPQQPTPVTPQETCVIDLLDIKLLCN